MATDMSGGCKIVRVLCLRKRKERPVWQTTVMLGAQATWTQCAGGGHPPWWHRSPVPGQRLHSRATSITPRLPAPPAVRQIMEAATEKQNFGSEPLLCTWGPSLPSSSSTQRVTGSAQEQAACSWETPGYSQGLPRVRDSVTLHCPKAHGHKCIRLWTDRMSTIAHAWYAAVTKQTFADRRLHTYAYLWLLFVRLVCIIPRT